MDGWISGRVDGWMDGRMVGSTVSVTTLWDSTVTDVQLMFFRQTDSQTDSRSDRQSDRQTNWVMNYPLMIVALVVQQKLSYCGHRH